MQPPHLILYGGMARSESPQVVDNLSLFIHFLFNELGPLLRVDCIVKYKRRQVICVFATQDYTLLNKKNKQLKK